LRAVTQTQQAQDDHTTMQDRMVASVVAALLAVQNGARVVRVHDVKETRQALQVWAATQTAGT
ncbi:MAG: dihydropteroate synthase, partial [Rhodoferax sp.]|nr:dihydropteroate synthase [Rhodoferax sp.]